MVFARKSHNLIFDFMALQARRIRQFTSVELGCFADYCRSFRKPKNVQDIQIKWPNDVYYQGKKWEGF